VKSEIPRTVVCHLIVGRFFVCFAIEFIEFTSRQYAVIFGELNNEAAAAAHPFNANDKLCNLPQKKKRRIFIATLLNSGFVWLL
jgi:hypothetical protein